MSDTDKVYSHLLRYDLRQRGFSDDPFSFDDFGSTEHRERDLIYASSRPWNEVEIFLKYF